MSLEFRNLLHHQRDLWTCQHAVVGSQRENMPGQKFVPNDAARAFHALLPPESLLMEVGSANGRDAHYWASNGHRVVAVDFVHLALTQLRANSRERGLTERVYPVTHDITTGTLPFAGGIRFDGFYSRSSLHIPDSTMLTLGSHINRLLCPGAVVLIEGKSCHDPKIKKSAHIGGGLMLDAADNYRIRRIWTEDFMTRLAGAYNWTVHSISEVEEATSQSVARYMRLIASAPLNGAAL